MKSLNSPNPSESVRICSVRGRPNIPPPFRGGDSDGRIRTADPDRRLQGMSRDAEYRDWLEATERRIIRPKRAPKGKAFPEWINVKSPVWARLAAVQFRRYLGKECRVGMNWDTSREGWMNIEVRSILNLDEEMIGAVGFRKTSRGWILEFVWIHPFYRNQRLLQSLWPEFMQRYGPAFIVARPLSRAMEAFLKNMGHPGYV